MPKKRKTPGTRQFEKRLFILCEGAKKHSEPAYLNAFIKDCQFKGERILVRVIDTKKNTGKELVREAKKCKEFDDDILWIVYDKNGYTRHSETFDMAKNNNINIAFSSISFEYWILLHFEFTAHPFINCDEIISRLKHKHNFFYDKADCSLYSKIKAYIITAIAHAKKIQKHQRDACPYSPVHQYNPYTNIDKLIENIKELEN